MLQANHFQKHCFTTHIPFFMLERFEDRGHSGGLFLTSSWSAVGTNPKVKITGMGKLAMSLRVVQTPKTFLIWHKMEYLVQKNSGSENDLAE